MATAIWIAGCVLGLATTLAVICLFAVMKLVEKYIDGGCGCNESKEEDELKNI